MPEIRTVIASANQSTLTNNALSGLSNIIRQEQEANQRMLGFLLRIRREDRRRTWNEDFAPTILAESMEALTTRRITIEEAIRNIQNLNFANVTPEEENRLRAALINSLMNNIGSICAQSEIISGTIGETANTYERMPNGTTIFNRGVRNANLITIRGGILDANNTYRHRISQLGTLDEILSGLNSGTPERIQPAGQRLISTPFTIRAQEAISSNNQMFRDAFSSTSAQITIASGTEHVMRRGTGQAAGFAVNAFTLGRAPELRALVEGGTNAIVSGGSYLFHNLYDLDHYTSASELGRDMAHIGTDTGINIATARIPDPISRSIIRNGLQSTSHELIDQALNGEDLDIGRAISNGPGRLLTPPPQVASTSPPAVSAPPRVASPPVVTDLPPIVTTPPQIATSPATPVVTTPQPALPAPLAPITDIDDPCIQPPYTPPPAPPTAITPPPPGVPTQQDFDDLINEGLAAREAPPPLTPSPAPSPALPPSSEDFTDPDLLGSGIAGLALRGEAARRQSTPPPTIQPLASPILPPTPVITPPPTVQLPASPGQTPLDRFDIHSNLRTYFRDLPRDFGEEQGEVEFILSRLEQAATPGGNDLTELIRRRDPSLSQVVSNLEQLAGIHARRGETELANRSRQLVQLIQPYIVRI